MSNERPAPLVPSSERVRAARVLSAVVLAATTALFVIVLVGLMRAPPPPSIDKEPPAARPLSSHVLLVLVDGLRYRDAIDVARMPSFSRHMREDTHALLLAGRVTMTSAAVLAIGTGLSGDFAQIVTNVDAGRTQASELFGEARAHGLRTGLVGDDTWVKLYGPFDEQIAHEHELALGKDNSAEMIAAATELFRGPRRPELAIAHFVTPDSTGHAVGAGSAAYYEVLTRFDERLGAFFDSLPLDETVIAISDHGMKSNGTHGADSMEERSCPLFARGPGIKRSLDLGTVDQIDLASTLAALLGVSTPNASRGTALVQMLDVPPDEAASIVCADARRVTKLERAEGDSSLLARSASDLAACAAGRASARLEAGRRVVRAYDAANDTALKTAGVLGTWASASFLVLLVLLSAKLGARLTASPARIAQLVPTIALAALTVALTYGVDRITPPWHNVARGVVYALANLPLAALLWAPRSAEAFFARRPALALAALPAVLAFTFSTRLQMEAWAVLAVALLVFASAEEGVIASRVRAPSWGVALTGLTALALLFPAARYVDLVDALAAPPPRLLAVAHLAIALWLAGGAKARDGAVRLSAILVAITIASGSLLLSHELPSWVGSSLAVVLAALGVHFFTTARTLACGLLFGAFGLVARDVDVLSVVGAVIAAELFADVSFEALSHGDLLTRPFVLGLSAAALFSLLFLVRVSVQGGIDFVTIDWTAGTFASLRVPSWLVGVANGWKYVVAAGLVLSLALARAPLRHRTVLLGAVALLFALRSAHLAWELFACREAYFTAFHAFGDLPSALLYAFAAALALPWLARREARALVPA